MRNTLLPFEQEWTCIACGCNIKKNELSKFSKKKVNFINWLKYAAKEMYMYRRIENKGKWWCWKIVWMFIKSKKKKLNDESELFDKYRKMVKTFKKISIAEQQ